uniref:RRM domain-containing protein n=2 Tax=Aegilops tauschii subsp. strangulata TaxID=200361 RepID=A0A453PUF9_AEGTS
KPTSPVRPPVHASHQVHTYPLQKINKTKHPCTTTGPSLSLPHANPEASLPPPPSPPLRAAPRRRARPCSPTHGAPGSRRRRDLFTMARLYVGNLDARVTAGELEDEFRVFGVLRSVWVARKPPGFAFIDFDDKRDAEDALRDLDGNVTISLVEACLNLGQDITSLLCFLDLILMANV